MDNDLSHHVECSLKWLGSDSEADGSKFISSLSTDTLMLGGSQTDRQTEKHNILCGANYKLEIRSVERGICPIDNSTMNQLFP